MNSVLAEAIEAHGGLDRWKAIVTVEADVNVGGGLHQGKGNPSLGTMHYVAETSEQAGTITFELKPEVRSVFRSDRVAIETADGRLVKERFEPRSSFDSHDLTTPWDMTQRAYFGGYATWGYLTIPFSLAVDGAQVWDVDPIEDGDETWRGIRVVLPARYATHSRAQEFYFGSDGLLRRQDYTLDVAGGVKIANYALDIVDVDGLKLPSKRRAFMCDKRYTVLRDRPMISLDVTNLRFNKSRRSRT